jgi:hypothetical protein
MKSKRVKFNEKVFIKLIPCLEEYDELDLCSALWWSTDELNSFRRLSQRNNEVLQMFSPNSKTPCIKTYHRFVQAFGL